MAHEVTVERRGAELLVRKRARGEAAARALEHEAAMLERARHPGVVRLVAFHRDDGSRSLVTAFVGNHSLATAPPRTLADLARVLADLAETLADLHGIGVVHGDLQPSHVLLDAAGRPRLCGLGRATGPGSVAPGGAVATGADDVQALGGLLLALVDRHDALGDRPRPRRVRTALLDLGGRLAHDHPERVPPARAVAVELRRLAGGTLPEPSPTDPLDADAAPGDRDRSDGPEAALGPLDAIDRLRRRSDLAVDAPSRTRTRARTAVAVAVVLALVVVAGAALLRQSSGARDRTAASGPSTTGPTAATAPTGATVAAPGCAHVESPDQADVDGDGCAEAVAIDGRELRAAGRRYLAGLPGDVVAVGDWDCDGRRTPAVLRPATGEVFLFRDWADADGDTVVDATVAAPGATDLAPAPDSCGLPALVDREGRHLESRPAAADGS